MRLMVMRKVNLIAKMTMKMTMMTTTMMMMMMMMALMKLDRLK